MKNKRIWTLLGVFVITLLLIKAVLKPGEKYEIDEGRLYSQSAYVYNLTDEKEVFAFNEEEKRAMASLTKTMTVLVGLDYIVDFEEIAPMSTEYYQKLVAENFVVSPLSPGEQTNYNDILYAILLPSGADAVYSLVENLGFTELEFIQLMNEKVESLNLENTHYENIVGGDSDGHYTSAKDMATILKTCLENPKYKEILTASQYTTHPTPTHPEGVLLKSTVLNQLTPEMEEGFEIFGGKSGTTENAGLCWATFGEVHGKEYIVVTMGAPWKTGSIEDGNIRDTIYLYENLRDVE